MPMLMPMPMPINTKRCSLFFSILQVNGLWGQLTALKKVVTEPKGTGEAFDTVMKEYYSAIRKGQGGLFMAVCRGKVHTVCLCLIARDQQYPAQIWHSDSSQHSTDRLHSSAVDSCRARAHSVKAHGCAR